ncbi:hypothetical protein CLU99_0163 [Flavobacterium sp. 2]|nr:hypothetical protein CLU99_0163 [Flavobacterium sp. 2]
MVSVKIGLIVFFSWSNTSATFSPSLVGELNPSSMYLQRKVPAPSVFFSTIIFPFNISKKTNCQFGSFFCNLICECPWC